MRYSGPGGRGRRWAVELVAGLVAGLLAGIVGFVVGMIIGGNLGGPNACASGTRPCGYEDFAWIGLVIGVTIGGATGVYVAGRRRATGSYTATIMSSILGVLLGAILLLVSGGTGPRDFLLNTHRLALPTVFGMTLVGGMLGFELTHSRMHPAASEADESPVL